MPPEGPSRPPIPPPEEAARAIAFLASPAASFTSGTNLLVDGALTRSVQV